MLKYELLQIYKKKINTLIKKLANNMNKSITKGNTNGAKIVEKIPRFPHNKQI